MISYEYSFAPIESFKSFPFAFSYPETPSDTLVSSILKIGIITPLLVTRKKGEFHIVDGYRRLRAARQANIKQIPIAIAHFEAREALLRTYLQAQQAHRRLNPFELANLVSKGPRAFQLPLDTVLRIILDEALISLSPRDIFQLPKILTLPLEIKREALLRSFTGAFLLKLATIYSPDLLRSISVVFRYFSLSENQLNNLLEWIDEIVRRDHCDPGVLLKQDPFFFILRHPKMPTAKKRDAFLKAIYRVRFPKRAAVERAYWKIAQKVTLSGNIKLIPPRNFTGKRFELRIAFENPKEFQEVLEKLSLLQNDLKNLFLLV